MDVRMVVAMEVHWVARRAGTKGGDWVVYWVDYSAAAMVFEMADLRGDCWAD